MNSISLIETLKKELNKREITYKILAERLDLSEANVKRFFSEKNFSLRRLDEICEAIGIDLGHLLRASENAIAEEPKQFSESIEEELTANPDLLLAFYSLALGGSAAMTRKRLGVDKAALHRITRQLESLGVLEVLPHEAFRLSYSKSTRWRADGPLVKRYGLAIRDEFFASAFQGELEHQYFLTGALSRESFLVLKRKLIDLFRQFDQLSRMDAKLADGESEIFWFYSGLRPWAPLAVIERGQFTVDPSLHPR